MKTASQCDRVLAVLDDGQPHTITEIHERAGTMRLNSRVAELRKRGHDIVCDRKGFDYRYQLRDSLSSPAGTPNDWGRTVPAGDLSEVGTPDPGSALRTSASLASSGEPMVSGEIPEQEIHHSTRVLSETGSPEPLSLASDDSDEQLSIFEAAA